jgi:hypothetical protein
VVAGRELDIQTLCGQVLETAVQYEYDPQGPDGFKCIFCNAFKPENKPVPLEHDLDCAVLLAKDLSTGIREVDPERSL